MTVGGVPGYAVRTIIPAYAGMTVGGVPGYAVRTIIPAYAGMTGIISIHDGLHPFEDAREKQDTLVGALL